MMELSKKLICMNRHERMQMVIWPEYHYRGKEKPSLFLEKLGKDIQKQLEQEMYGGLVRQC